ncbi:MAG: VOC family protein [Pseudomonadota bacterium]
MLPSRFRVHHLGVLVADLAESVATYTSALGYRVESDPIDDVEQTARVQFLRLPDANHWVELVTPLGAQSKLTAALERGTSLHHICYESDGIEDDLARLRSDGFMPLSRPVPGAAFDGRLIAWLVGPGNLLVELVEAGPGIRSLAALRSAEPAS